VTNGALSETIAGNSGVNINENPTVVPPNAIFKTNHYAERLNAAGVNVGHAESTVIKEISSIRDNMAVNADVVGRIRVDGVLIEYPARLLEDGSVNIGTIFPVK
jgi:hypothetical protein